MTGGVRHEVPDAHVSGRRRIGDPEGRQVVANGSLDVETALVVEPHKSCADHRLRDRGDRENRIGRDRLRIIDVCEAKASPLGCAVLREAERDPSNAVLSHLRFDQIANGVEAGVGLGC